MKRVELLKALERVKMPLSEGKMIQFAGLIIFDEDLLVSYGDSVSASVLLKSGIKAAIRHEDFIKLIGKIKEDEIEMETDDKQLIVKYGKNSEAGFALVAYDQDKIPNFGIDKIEEMIAVPKDFSEALGFSCFSAGGDSGIEILENVKVEAGRVISTDKYRITVRDFSEPIKIEEPFLVPYKVASFLSRFGINAITVDGSCVHYQDDEETIFTHRMVDGENFPNVDQFLEVKGTEVVFPETLSQSLVEAQVASGDEDVSIKIDKDGISVMGDRSDVWVKSKLEFKYKGKKIEIKSSPKYLLQILNKSNETVVNEDVLYFKGPNFSHLICLMG